MSDPGKLMAPFQKSYWQPFSHDGAAIALDHLEPFEFQCATPDGNERCVRVIYSPHVFTRGAIEMDPVESICFDRRVFCPNRYEDSHLLPGLLANLPKIKVFQTWEKRNYLFLSVNGSGDEKEPYHIFFQVMKRGGKKRKHVELRVESAYRMATSTYAPPARPNSIRFTVLVQNVFMGRQIKFSPR